MALLLRCRVRYAVSPESFIRCMDSVFGCQSLLWLKYHRSPAFVKKFWWEIFSFNERYNVFNTSAEGKDVYTPTFPMQRRAARWALMAASWMELFFTNSAASTPVKKDVAPE